MSHGVDPANRAVTELACEPAAKVYGALPSLAEEHGEALRIEIPAQGAGAAPKRQDVSRHHSPNHPPCSTEEVCLPAAGRGIRVLADRSRAAHLAACLAASSGVVLERDDLLERVWGKAYRGEYEILRVALWRLRQKLKENGSSGFIVNRPGIGYMFAPEGAAP